MPVRPDRQITYDDYLTFPDEPRLEVIEGEAFVVPSPNRRHQEVVGRFYLRLGNHVEQHGGGAVFIAPFDVVLTNTDIVQPDILFISDAELDVLTDANVRGTPSWVIEVLSSTHPERDRKLKLAYERTGVPEYWIVDPQGETVSVYRLEAGKYGVVAVFRVPDAVRPLVLQGFELSLGDLFGR